MGSLSAGEIVLGLPFAVALIVIFFKNLYLAISCYRKGGDYKYHIVSLLCLIFAFLAAVILVLVARMLN